MDTESALWEMLKNDYGISTVGGLLTAIEKQATVDVSIFCSEEDCENE